MSDVISISRQNLVLPEKIGEGAFSTVYRMVWKTSSGDQQVAVKKLNKVDDRELKALSALKHKHIVQLLAVVDEGIDFMLVLELCEGGSVRSYLDNQNNNRLPLSQLFDWLEQTAIPIQYLKKEEIIHKDIKAANYLISNGNILKLADFGLAKYANKTHSNATDRGTCGWMAPELFIDNILSPTFDIYAYGVTLWELVTTEIPFRDREPQWVTYHVCQNGVRPKIPQDCPKALQDLMTRCWHADRHKRPGIEEVLFIIRKTKESEIRRLHQPQPLPESEVVPRVARMISRQPSMGVWVYESQFLRNDRGNDKLSSANGIALDTIRSRVLIADGDASKVNVYNLEGRILFPMSIWRGTKPGEKSKPHQVAVNRVGGTYFVTDGTSVVKEFHDDGSIKATFPSIPPASDSVTQSGSAQESKLEGLAVDLEGCLLVGDVSNLHISKHVMDERHTQEDSIAVTIEPYDLAVTFQNDIIVSSYRSHRIQILDQQGKLLRSLRPDTSEVPQWSPYGVACDHALLFVCNWATDKGRGVHCYSLSNFEYLGCIIHSDGSPRGLALIENGCKLVVSQVIAGIKVTVKVYRRR